MLFARMSKRRMANVMNECKRFREIRVKVQRVRNSASDLRHFKRVRKTVTEVVGIAGREDLRLGFQPAKSTRMNYAIAIASKIGAVGMRSFSVSAPSRQSHIHRVECQRSRRHFRGSGLAGQEG